MKLTRKEEKLSALYELRRQLAELKGNQIPSLYEYMSTAEFQREARANTLASLDSEIDYVWRQIKQLQEKQAAEKWYATAEGAEYKLSKEREIEALKAQMKSVFETMLRAAKETCLNVLGGDWCVCHLSGNNIEFGVVAEWKADGTGKALFGHEFTCYFGDSWTDDTRWELNYGTMGGFDIERDESRVEFLVGLGKFVGNRVEVPALRDVLQKGYEERERLAQQVNALEDRIEHPEFDNKF